MWGCNVPTQYFFNTVTTHQSASNKKSVTMHSSIITDFRAFHLLLKFVRSLFAVLFRTFLVTDEQSLVFNLRAAEKDLFLFRRL